MKEQLRSFLSANLINPFKSNLKRPLFSITELDEPKSTLRKEVVDDKDSGVTLQAFRPV